MIILGIDTATAAASAAIVEDARLVVEETGADFRASGNGAAPHRGNHAETLLPLIDKLLDTAGLRLTDVSAFAVAIGPGSFTGLRIGLSTVKGLAYGSEAPVVGIPTLAAVAARVNDGDGFICPFLDARKKEVYAALFCRSGGRLERVSEDIAAAPEKVVESVRRLTDGEPCVFIGDAARTYAEVVKESLGEKGRLTLGENYPSVASAVAFLAEEKILRRECDPVGPLVPLYLRPSEAELKRKP
ncbi:MAG TPA: tRNA (adenosine(37)-N6)-threonylcarbamoyltransferase complex dimerization subunit type 1 TsaB [Candidatus Binatia bacterium]|jgi:tRNA threonylcarbamoyladenosine biosynthesis protein TsaB